MMNYPLTALFLMQPTGKASAGSNYGTFLFMGAAVLIMYFFMIRPNSKKSKMQKDFNESIQKGDRIVTIAGIHGKITKMNEDGTIQIEIGPGNFMTIEKSAISMDYTQAHIKRTETKKAQA
ncbi:MAG TPA: preprotein translocase subunit YajC [Chitinophagaceae bacterium]|nr:preprotein translocase subunit YajC [Chitinophagaceae bacterium]